MVNVNMFKGAFDFKPQPAAQPQPQFIPNPQYVAPAQPQVALQPVKPEDPEIAKLRFLMLKWLSIVIGGSAILLIVWRVALKFF